MAFSMMRMKMMMALSRAIWTVYKPPARRQPTRARRRAQAMTAFSGEAHVTGTAQWTPFRQHHSTNMRIHDHAARRCMALPFGYAGWLS